MSWVSNEDWQRWASKPCLSKFCACGGKQMREHQVCPSCCRLLYYYDWFKYNRMRNINSMTGKPFKSPAVKSDVMCHDCVEHELYIQGIETDFQKSDELFIVANRQSFVSMGLRRKREQLAFIKRARKSNGGFTALNITREEAVQAAKELSASGDEINAGYGFEGKAGGKCKPRLEYWDHEEEAKCKASGRTLMKDGVPVAQIKGESARAIKEVMDRLQEENNSPDRIHKMGIDYTQQIPGHDFKTGFIGQLTKPKYPKTANPNSVCPLCECFIEAHPDGTYRCINHPKCEYSRTTMDLEIGESDE